MRVFRQVSTRELEEAIRKALEDLVYEEADDEGTPPTHPKASVQISSIEYGDENTVHLVMDIGARLFVGPRKAPE